MEEDGVEEAPVAEIEDTALAEDTTCGAVGVPDTAVLERDDEVADGEEVVTGAEGIDVI